MTAIWHSAHPLSPCGRGSREARGEGYRHSLTPATWPELALSRSLAEARSAPLVRAPWLTPLAGTLMPDVVPPPPARPGTARTVLAIAGTALAAIVGVAAPLAIFAVNHGWFG
jgi:hypothetical protein